MPFEKELHAVDENTATQPSQVSFPCRNNTHTFDAKSTSNATLPKYLML